ncbi:MAG: Phenylalanine--tRNA ligase alpha subunit [Candidatus Methanolliviera sp. GoM_oil]|nr:MAG: Phenylalanine--tRNA ligase alpha subunit [Candidatus Methanolliviera sp. GoM_oil]
MKNLTLNEAKTLKALRSGENSGENSGKKIPEYLAKKVGIKVEALMQAAYFLQEKNLVDIDERLEEEYELTEEGERYAREGLPERDIHDFVVSKGGEVYLSDLRKEFPEIINIGFGWLKRKNWVKTDKRGEDFLVIALKAPIGRDEEILKELTNKPRKNPPMLDKSTLKLLKGRKLLNIHDKKYIKIKLAEDGEEVARGIKVEDYEEITKITPEMIREKSWIGKRFRGYDAEVLSKEIYPAKKHPYRRIIEEIRDISLRMGFVEIKGEIIQSSFWDFDALFQPQDHPARDMQDTFYLNSESKLPERYVKEVREMHIHGGKVDSSGWGGEWSEEVARRNVLRTHTTALTIRYLAEHPDPPVKAFCIGRVYRRESIDATHLPEFEQLEGVIMDKGVSFKDLLGYLKAFYREMGFEEIRFRPGYFPYTEPSVEPDVYVDGLGWVELGGAGVFRKEVTEPFGINYPVLAWGLGVSRLAMLKLGLRDLRELYRPDIDWLRKSPLFEGF